MYSLDTVVKHTKNVFVKKVVLDVKKWVLSQTMAISPTSLIQPYPSLIIN